MGKLYTYLRLVVVVVNFLPLALSYVRDSRKYIVRHNERPVTASMRQSRAERLKSSMLTLGPTYIKLGQVLSTRPDVLPPEYIEVLSTLQDEVPPAEWDAVSDVIETELDMPVDDAYDQIDTDAISGASLGQVHKASVNGRDVAVKVRRPGIEKQIAADVDVIRRLKIVIMKYIGDARAFSVETLVDEFSETIEEEMDYEREFNELTTVRQNFAQNPEILIPEPLASRSSERVLTMEYVDGIKIDNTDKIESTGIDTQQLSSRVQRAYFDMIIKHGVFHADPHPGNLAVKPDGRLVFYDFGMTGRISDRQAELIIDAYVNIARDNVYDVLDALVELGVVNKDANRDVLADVLELAIRDARGLDVDQRKVEDVLGSAQDQLYEFPFRIPPNFSLLLRVSAIANGVCYELDPSVDFIGEVTTILKEEGYVQSTAIRYAREAAASVLDAVKRLATLPFQAEKATRRINEDAIEIDVREPPIQTQTAAQSPTDTTVATSVIAAGLFITGGVMYGDGGILSLGFFGGGLIVLLYLSLSQ